MPAGRPTKFSDDLASQIVALHQSGQTLRLIAQTLRVSRESIHNWRIRYPEQLAGLGPIRSLAGPASCAWCGTLFARDKGRACCSTTCDKARKSNRMLVLYHLAVSTGRVRAGMACHRALVAYLAERDGNRCCICHRAIDLTLRSGPQGDPLGPSLDHVVPRSQGGPDSLANLRLTHWACNLARGNRGGNEQLRLVG